MHTTHLVNIFVFLRFFILNRTGLRKQIGVVPQDTVLFNAPIGFNIGYGNLNASKEDVVAAAKTADVHDSIVRMNNG
jgi:ATP-binding cassette subfamily B (MDR/TAP) protein 6